MAHLENEIIKDIKEGTHVRDFYKEHWRHTLVNINHKHVYSEVCHSSQSNGGKKDLVSVTLF